MARKKHTKRKVINNKGTDKVKRTRSIKDIIKSHSEDACRFIIALLFVELIVYYDKYQYQKIRDDLSVSEQGITNACIYNVIYKHHEYCYRFYVGDNLYHGRSRYSSNTDHLDEGDSIEVTYKVEDPNVNLASYYL